MTKQQKIRSRIQNTILSPRGSSSMKALEVPESELSEFSDF